MENPLPQDVVHSLEVLVPRQASLSEDIGMWAAQVVGGVKRYVEEQRDLWKLLPSLCLEAEGRSGYHEETYWMYERKIYPIYIPGEYRRVWIDLETGGLFSDTFMRTEGKQGIPASAEEIFALVPHMYKLNAVNILGYYLNVAKQPYANEGQEETAERFKVECRRKYQLEKPDLLQIDALIEEYAKINTAMQGE